MLVKLLPEQVVKVWNEVAISIEEAHPASMKLTPGAMNRVLRSILIGALEVWYITDDHGAKVGILTTNFNDDLISGTRSLNVYTLWASGGISRKIWLDGISTLFTYAKANNCQKITGFTIIPAVVELIKRAGGQAELTYVELEV